MLRNRSSFDGSTLSSLVKALLSHLRLFYSIIFSIGVRLKFIRGGARVMDGVG